MPWSRLHWYGRSTLNGCVGSKPASPALMVDCREHPEHLRTSEDSGEDEDDSGAARIHGRGWALHSPNFLVQRSATALKEVPLAPALLTLRQLQHRPKKQRVGVWDCTASEFDMAMHGAHGGLSLSPALARQIACAACCPAAIASPISCPYTIVLSPPKAGNGVVDSGRQGRGGEKSDRVWSPAE